jgi:hypothetical protein
LSLEKEGEMRVLILDGNPKPQDEDFRRYLGELASLLEGRGHDVRRQTLSGMDIRYCTGCWGCWIKTPGQCVFPDDSYDVCREYIRSDLVLMASPVVMGFTSAVLKKTQDRLIPLLHPYFDFVRGECHHRKRYETYPRLGILMKAGPDTDDEDFEIITDMFSRFALNFKTELVLSGRFDRAVEEVADAIDRL